MNVPGLITKTEQAIAAVDKAITYLPKAAREFADADNEYRKAKSLAYLAQKQGTVEERKALVDKVCELERLRAHLAEAQWKAALQAVKARTAQLSARQSILNAVRQEMKFEQTKPSEFVT